MTGGEYIKIGKESDFLPELMHDSDEGRLAHPRGEIFYMDFPYFQSGTINLHTDII